MVYNFPYFFFISFFIISIRISFFRAITHFVFSQWENVVHILLVRFSFEYKSHFPFSLSTACNCFSHYVDISVHLKCNSVVLFSWIYFTFCWCCCCCCCLYFAVGCLLITWEFSATFAVNVNEWKTWDTTKTETHWSQCILIEWAIEKETEREWEVLKR